MSELVSYPGVSASKACTFHGQTVSPHWKSMANPLHSHINAKFEETEVGAIGTRQKVFRLNIYKLFPTKNAR